MRIHIGCANKRLCGRGRFAPTAIDMQRRHTDGDEASANQRETFRTPPPSKAQRSGTKRLATASVGSMLARPSRTNYDDEQVQSANKQVQQLQARSDLAKDVRQTLSDSTCGRSFYMILKKKLEVCTDDQVQSLELDPKAVLLKHENETVQPLTELDKLAAKLPLKDVVAKKASRFRAQSPSRGCHRSPRPPSPNRARLRGAQARATLGLRNSHAHRAETLAFQCVVVGDASVF